MMISDPIPPQEEENSEHEAGALTLPLALTCALTTGGTLTTAITIASLMNPHIGLGLWFGDFALTVIAYVFGPDILGKRPSPPPQLPTHRERPRSNGSPRRSKVDRLLGRNFHDAADPIDTHLPDVGDDCESLFGQSADLVIAEANVAYERNAPMIPAARPIERESGDHRRSLVVRAHDPSREVLLAPNLGLDIQEVAESGIFIVGMKGSGKSTVAARVMEQVGRWPIIQVVFDIKGDYVSLVEESKFLHGRIFTREDSIDFGQVWRNHEQVVIDLRTWPSIELRTRIVANFNKALLKYAMGLPEHLRQFYFVHLDEGQQFASQTCPDEVKKETWHAAKSSFANLGAIGRASGAVPCLYTQRIADIHKDVIAHQEILIFMKAALNNDLDRYHEYVNVQIASDEMIRSFGPGDGAVVLPNGTQFVTHFLNRESRHGSHSPQFEQVLELYHHRPVWNASRPLPAYSTVEAGSAFGSSMEAASQASLQDNTYRFQGPLPESESGVEISESSVGSDIREAIKRMRKDGLSHRKVAAYVGLGGRKWSLYQQVCREEKIIIDANEKDESE